MAKGGLGPVRSKHGQGIAESGIVLVVGTTLAIGLVMFLLNLARVSSCNYRLQSIASQAARQIIANEYFLDMQLGEFDDDPHHLVSAEPSSDGASTDIGKNCRYLVDQELEMVGLPASTNFKIKSYDRTIMDHRVRFIEIDYDVPGLQVISANMFPASYSLHAHGFASSSKHSVSTHGICLIHVVDVDSTGRPTGVERGIRVPIINATINDGAGIRDQSAAGNLLRAGETIGKCDTACMTLHVTHDGIMNLNTHLDASKNFAGSRSWKWGPWKSKLTLPSNPDDGNEAPGSTSGNV